MEHIWGWAGVGVGVLLGLTGRCSAAMHRCISGGLGLVLGLGLGCSWARRAGAPPQGVAACAARKGGLRRLPGAVQPTITFPSFHLLKVVFLLREPLSSRPGGSWRVGSGPDPRQEDVICGVGDESERWVMRDECWEVSERERERERERRR